MSKTSQSDTSRVVKNPLLSAATYALDDFTQNAILLPAAPPAPPIAEKPETEDQLKPSVFSGEPIIDDSETFSEISLDQTSDTELCPSPYQTEQQNETIPTLLEQLPSVASSVFSSFSNILKGTGPGSNDRSTVSGQPPIADYQHQDYANFNRISYSPEPNLITPVLPEVFEPPVTPTFYSPDETKTFTPSPIPNSVPSSNSGNVYRLSSKKKIYAQLPGLHASSGVTGSLHHNPVHSYASTGQTVHEPTQEPQTKAENNAFSISSIFTAAPKLFNLPKSSIVPEPNPSVDLSPDIISVSSSTDHPLHQNTEKQPEPIFPWNNNQEQHGNAAINPALFNVKPILTQQKPIVSSNFSTNIVQPILNPESHYPYKEDVSDSPVQIDPITSVCPATGSVPTLYKPNCLTSNLSSGQINQMNLTEPKSLTAQPPISYSSTGNSAFVSCNQQSFISPLPSISQLTTPPINYVTASGHISSAEHITSSIASNPILEVGPIPQPNEKCQPILTPPPPSQSTTSVISQTSNSSAASVSTYFIPQPYPELTTPSPTPIFAPETLPQPIDNTLTSAFSSSTSQSYYQQSTNYFVPTEQPLYIHPAPQGPVVGPPLASSVNKPPTGNQTSNYRLRGKPHYKNPLGAYSTPVPKLPEQTQTGLIPSNVSLFNPIQPVLETSASPALESYGQPTLVQPAVIPPVPAPSFNFFNPTLQTSGPNLTPESIEFPYKQPGIIQPISTPPNNIFNPITQTTEQLPNSEYKTDKVELPEDQTSGQVQSSINQPTSASPFNFFNPTIKTLGSIPASGFKTDKAELPQEQTLTHIQPPLIQPISAPPINFYNPPTQIFKADKEEELPHARIGPLIQPTNFQPISTPPINFFNQTAPTSGPIITSAFKTDKAELPQQQASTLIDQSINQSVPATPINFFNPNTQTLGPTTTSEFKTDKVELAPVQTDNTIYFFNTEQNLEQSYVKEKSPPTEPSNSDLIAEPLIEDSKCHSEILQQLPIIGSIISLTTDYTNSELSIQQLAQNQSVDDGVEPALIPSALVEPQQLWLQNNSKSSATNFFNQKESTTDGSSTDKWSNSNTGDEQIFNEFQQSNSLLNAESELHESNQSELLIQNFFNNPPPLFTYAIPENEIFLKTESVNKHLQSVALTSAAEAESVSISSNVVEPPSSAQSELSESAELLADTPIRSEEFPLREQKTCNPTDDVLNSSMKMASDSTDLSSTAILVYRPVYKHWFYKKSSTEVKQVWTPFSMVDSLNLEGATTDEIVTTDGGRFDVNKETRQRIPVYWNSPPDEVRRCSWFYKGIDSKLTPYNEEIADKLEDLFRNSVNSGEWHQKLTLENGETVIFHSPNVIVHFLASESPDSWPITTTPQTTNRPRIVKRGVDEFNIEDGESEQIDHLMFMVHGIGSACDLKFRPVEEVVDDFRCISQQLIQSHYRSSCDKGEVGRVEILPISWHIQLHSGEAGIDEKMKGITLESIPKLRAFTNDTLLDILFYTSPRYCQKIMNTVAGSLNDLYTKFCQRNATFKGSVSLAGHSLGSVILFDLLQNQKPFNDAREKNKKPLENTMEEHYNVSPSDVLETDFIVGQAGTGQPYIKYPQLIFHPKKFFALGSPIGMFVTVRGIDSLGINYKLPTTEGFYNIFHPFDPVAYRIEALINTDLTQLRPVLVPHHKGRKRMHIELRETMARVGADIKQKILDTYKTTMNTVYSFALLQKTDQKTIQQEVDKVLDEQLKFDRTRVNSSSSTSSEIDGGETDIPLGELNAGKRIDYVLQEAPLESFNEYLFALTSHVCYWESEDTTLFIIKEIYSSLGKQTDNQVPQQSMTIERPVSSTSNASNGPNA